MRALLPDNLSPSPPLLAAAGVVLLTLAGLAWLAWSAWDALNAPPAAGRHAPVSDTAPVDPLPLILSGNLFGESGASVATSGAAPARQATGFTLRAAFAPVGGGEGGAIIESTGGEAKWYAIGDEVSGGLRLHEVHPDHVLLDRSGSLERLAFPRLSELAVTGSPATSALPDTAPPGVESGGAVPIPADAPADEKARIIRQRLEELRNRTRT
jgi:general secretion pathway protein C